VAISYASRAHTRWFCPFLAARARRRGYRSHVERAAGCILANGPVTQERWENATGYSPASIAAEIAGGEYELAARPAAGSPGEGTGSATPLGWTHAQFIRLAWSIDAGRPVERPNLVSCRYGNPCSTGGS
jgi:hypothetical protein